MIESFHLVLRVTLGSRTRAERGVVWSVSHCLRRALRWTETTSGADSSPRTRGQDDTRQGILLFGRSTGHIRCETTQKGPRTSFLPSLKFGNMILQFRQIIDSQQVKHSSQILAVIGGTLLICGKSYKMTLIHLQILEMIWCKVTMNW